MATNAGGLRVLRFGPMRAQLRGIEAVLAQLHALARRAVREVPGLVSAEFFTQAGLDILVAHAGLAPPLPGPAVAYLLLEASGPGAFGDLADVIGDREAAVGRHEDAVFRRRSIRLAR